MDLTPERQRRSGLIRKLMNRRFEPLSPTAHATVKYTAYRFRPGSCFTKLPTRGSLVHRTGLHTLYDTSIAIFIYSLL